PARPRFCSLCLLLCQLSSVSPYTTLFRSVRKLLAETNHDCYPVVIDRKLHGAITREHLQRIIDHGEAPIIDAVATCRRDATIREDRKSTRLNSSHVKISYAVFCMKKENRH